MRGSLRNHESWRRANCRVAMTVRSRGLVEGELPGEMGHHLAVADRAGGGAALGQPLVEQPLDLGHEAGREHRRHPLLDPGVQGGPVDGEPDLEAERVDVLEVREGGAERPPGDLDDLERADDAPAVVGADPLGGLGVELGQSGVQRGRADGLELGLPAGAHLLVGARELEPVQDRAGVERGAADQDRDRAVCRAAARRRRAPSPGTPPPSPARAPTSRSSRWCGMPRRSAGGSFAVPMSMPR